MACYNTTQWSGNFTSAGVGSIGVDFRDSGNTDLVMRLVFFSADTSTQWVSNATASLAAGSSWQHFTFTVDPALFTQVTGTTSFASTISSANRMMFRHDPGSPSSTGVTMAGSLGVDNVHANPVPEPATLLVIGAGLAAILKRRRS
jgi:hypothetical protein